MKKYPKTLKNEFGFTLLELIVVVLIVGIIGAVVGNLIGNQAKIFNTIFNNSDLMDDGRNTIDLLRKDIHNLAADSISTMSSVALTFTDNSDATIEYYYLNNMLSRNGSVIAENLQEVPFKYLDATKSEVFVPDSLSLIQVTLNFRKHSESIKIEEVIFVRN